MKLDLASRSQLQTIHSLGTNRNASRVLKNMDKYLNHFTDMEHIYYMNKAGRDLVGSKRVINKTMQYKHILMRNDIYVLFRCPEHWQNEFPIKIPDLTFYADSVFMVGQECFFLEVDNEQKMKENKLKMEKYKAFEETGLWQDKNNGTFPTLIFYTKTIPRKHQLMEMGQGLKLKVFTRKDLQLS